MFRYTPLSISLSNVMDFVPFQPKQTKFLIPVCNLELKYPLFHLKSNSGQFRDVFVFPVNFCQYQPKLKIRPECTFEFFHLILKFKHKIDIRSIPNDLLGEKNQRRRQHRLVMVANDFLGEKKPEKKTNYWYQMIYQKGKKKKKTEGEKKAKTQAMWSCERCSSLLYRFETLFFKAWNFP